MHLSILSTWTVADLTIRYLHDPATGTATLQLVPAARLSELAEGRAVFAPVPLVQVTRAGGSSPGAFARGCPPRFVPAGAAFRFAEQAHEVEGTLSAIVTMLVDEARGHWIEHRLSWHEGDPALWSDTAFLNDGDVPVTLEALSVFSFGGLSPFAPADAIGRLRVLRFRSPGGGEAHPIAEATAVEQLGLMHSRSGGGPFQERFDQAGSGSARPWLPFVALEDTQAGVTWAAQLGRTASWQMELSRQDGGVCLSGGLAGHEPGRRVRTLVPGEAVDAPPARLACVEGDLAAACERLAASRRPTAGAWPGRGHPLPLLFNE